MLHAAALRRHAAEKKQLQAPNKKQRSSLTAALKEVSSPAPAPPSYSTTLHIQPPKNSQETPRIDIEGGSARIDPSHKFSTIIPKYTYSQEPHNEPRAYEVYRRRRKVTKRRKRLGCFSCTRRLSTSSDGSVYSRPSSFAAVTNRLGPKPVLPMLTFDHDGSDQEVIVSRPVTPTLPPKAELAKTVSGKRPSLKYPQPRPGLVDIPRDSIIPPWIGQRPYLQAKGLEGDASTDTFSSELPSPEIYIRQSGRVSTENVGPSSRMRTNTDTLRRQQQGSLDLEKTLVPKAVSLLKARRSGRTGIPLSELGGACPRGRTNLISHKCILVEDAPLHRADSNRHPLHPVPKNSVYRKSPTLCWGCEDTKSKCDKLTGLCKGCELYLVPCLEWTSDKVMQTPRTTMYHPQEVLQIQRQGSNPPTLGQSATQIPISQPGVKGAALRAVYPPALPNSLPPAVKSDHEGHVSPPKPHFSNTTLATFSYPSSPRSEGDLSPFHYDSTGIPGKGIQALGKYWNSGTESTSAISGSSNCTTDRPREEVLLHPAPKAKGYIKCFNGPPSPMRLAESRPSPSPGSLTLPLLNPRQGSQKGAISGIYQHAEKQDIIGSWINFSDRDSGCEDNHQNAVDEPLLEEGLLTGSRLSRPISSIYSLYLDSP